MHTQVKCPVCKTELGSYIPDFCPVCGWECGTDITLFPSLSKPTNSELDYRRRKLDQSREIWGRTKEIVKHNADLAKALEEAGKQKPVIPQSGIKFNISSDLVLVEGSVFLMGADKKSASSIFERPAHKVRLNSFYLCKYMVTEAEWVAVMEPNLRLQLSKIPDLPALASWYGAIKYCNLRSIKEGLSPCYTIYDSTDQINGVACLI